MVQLNGLAEHHRAPNALFQQGMIHGLLLVASEQQRVPPRCQVLTEGTIPYFSCVLLVKFLQISDCGNAASHVDVEQAVCVLFAWDGESDELIQDALALDDARFVV